MSAELGSFILRTFLYFSYSSLLSTHIPDPFSDVKLPITCYEFTANKTQRKTKRPLQKATKKNYTMSSSSSSSSSHKDKKLSKKEREKVYCLCTFICAWESVLSCLITLCDPYYDLLSHNVFFSISSLRSIQELRDDGFKKISCVNLDVVSDRIIGDKRHERERDYKLKTQEKGVAALREKQPAVSATFDAFTRMAAGLERRSIADTLADSNRPTWEQYKKDNEDKLQHGGMEAKKMAEYRQQLDRERELKLSRGSNHQSKDIGISDSDEGEDDGDGDGEKKKKRKEKKSKKHKKEKKGKHKKDKKRKRDSDGSSSDDSDEEGMSKSNLNPNPILILTTIYP